MIAVLSVAMKLPSVAEGKTTTVRYQQSLD